MKSLSGSDDDNDDDDDDDDDVKSSEVHNAGHQPKCFTGLSSHKPDSRLRQVLPSL